MGRSVHADVLDGALDVIKNNANLTTICNAEPTTRTEAVTTFALGNIAITGTDFTIAPGDGGGDSRKITVAEKSKTGGVDTTDAIGANHVTWVDATRLLYVTTCTLQPVTAGNDLTIGSWKVEIGSPTA